MSYLTVNRFNSLFDNFFKEEFYQTPTFYRGTPGTEITNDDDSYQIELEVAGYKKKDISINITDDILTIKGRTKAGKVRSFQRNFTLDGCIIDYDKVSSSLEDGILLVKLPKKEEAKPKTINISVS